MLMRFWKEDDGQDLIEYSLLMAFLAIVGVGVAQGMHNSLTGIWRTSNTTLASAKTTAS